MRSIYGDYGYMSEADVERFFRFGFPTVVQVGRMRCWSWNGKREWQDYGRFYLNGQWRQAHRVFFIYINPRTLRLRRRAVEIPVERPHLDHRCNNRSCIRPAHLQPVTNKFNHELRAQRYFERKAKRRPRTIRTLHELIGEQVF